MALEFVGGIIDGGPIGATVDVRPPVGEVWRVEVFTNNNGPVVLTTGVLEHQLTAANTRSPATIVSNDVWPRYKPNASFAARGWYIGVKL